jgi:hypothetical protein
MTIFYCLRFETPPTWRASFPYLYSPGRGWPDYTPKHWASFSSPSMSRRARVEVLDPASTRVTELPERGCPNCLDGNSSSRTTQETFLLCCRCVFTAPLHNNSSARERVYRAVAQKRSLIIDSPLSKESIRHSSKG